MSTQDITRRQALGLAAGAALGTILGPAAAARAASGPVLDLSVITANIGRTGNAAAYETSLDRLRNGVVLNGEVTRSLVGFQEIGEADPNPAYERQQLERFFNVNFEKPFFAASGPGSHVPMAVPPAFKVTARRATFTHGGIPNVTPARFITEAVLQSTANPKLRFAFLNTHYIAGAYNGKGRDDLKGYWKKHYGIHRSLVQGYHRSGMPVLWTADTNNPNMPAVHPLERAAFRGGIDQIRWIPGTNGTELALRRTQEIDMTIDSHDAPVAIMAIRGAA